MLNILQPFTRENVKSVTLLSWIEIPWVPMMKVLLVDHGKTYHPWWFRYSRVDTRVFLYVTKWKSIAIKYECHPHNENTEDLYKLVLIEMVHISSQLKKKQLSKSVIIMITFTATAALIIIAMIRDIVSRRFNFNRWRHLVSIHKYTLGLW